MFCLESLKVKRTKVQRDPNNEFVENELETELQGVGQ